MGSRIRCAASIIQIDIQVMPEWRRLSIALAHIGNEDELRHVGVVATLVKLPGC